MALTIGHRLSRMTGRDPHEERRSATNLELFFDLVFVVIFSVAGTQVAHYLAEGHWRTAFFGSLRSNGFGDSVWRVPLVHARFSPALSVTGMDDSG